MGLLQRPGGRQNRLTFQKGFVVVQFVISIALATSQWFIFRQLSFMREHGGGFDQENLVTLPVRSLGNTAADRMKNTAVLVETLDRYRSQYGYGKVAVTEYVPGFGFRNLFKIYPDGDTYPDGLEVLSCDVDENFIEVFGLRAVQGRFFSNEFPADRDALVLNEAACRALGSKSVEGQRVGLIDKANRKEVVGVVNDINIKSLQYSIEPMIYQFGRHHNYPGYVSLRLEPGRGAATVEFIRAKWEELFPDVPFAYEGVKEKFRASYGEEERLARIIGMFSLLAVMLSLLGIFALSALESGKRIREIGIRRVNGARVIEVMLLLNLDFLKWVAVAFVLSMPAAWLAVHRWLGNFAYRTELSWWVFAVSGFGVILVSLFTVSWQSWRAATQNPVQSLRNE
jgi:putative ABC transport system permease protein